MSAINPTFILFHGAWGAPSAFDKLAPFLEKAGYPTLRATYPSADSKSPAEVTVQKDAEYARNEYFAPLIEKEHKDVIVVVHSLGGVVAGGAAVGLSKTDRKAKGFEGGVVGMIYIAGNILHENQTLLQAVGGQWPPWLVKDKPAQYLSLVDPYVETLAQDADESLKAEIEASLVPQGYLCFDTPAPAPCWAEKGYAGRLAYIRTAEDRMNPAFAQDLWIEGSGVKWDVVQMPTSHAPHLTQPQQLSEHILTFAGKFEKV